MFSKKLAIIFTIAILLVTSGCVTVKQDTIKLPYQKALEGYYAALNNLNGDDRSLAVAQAQVGAHLAKNPGDLEARVLRANIYLQLIRKTPDVTNHTSPFIKDLQFVVLSVGVGASEDWVQPRAYITLGDYFLIQGNHWKGKVSSQTNDNKYYPMLARTLYEAARNYYIQAHSLTNNTGTIGLKRELLNAQNGYVNAHQGMIAAIDLMGPETAGFEPAMNAKNQALESLRKFFEEAKVASIGSSLVGFDPAAHLSAKTTYNLLNNEITGAIKTWCGSDTNKALLNKPTLTPEEKRLVDDLKGLSEKRRLYSEYAATQSIIETVLTRNPLTPGLLEIQVVDNAYKRSLKTYCEGFSQ